MKEFKTKVEAQRYAKRLLSLLRTVKLSPEYEEWPEARQRKQFPRGINYV